jgi:hypothetical protein
MRGEAGLADNGGRPQVPRAPRALRRGGLHGGAADLAGQDAPQVPRRARPLPTTGLSRW